MTSMGPYESLQGPAAFRLLELQPSLVETAPLVCGLLTSTWDSTQPLHHPYEALSYTWGKPKFDHKITLSSVQFEVTENLFAALTQLRSQQEPRILWVDTVCIDQKNIEERNAQVANMPDIYRGAKRVFVWLGREEDDSGMAMELLADIEKGIIELPGFELRWLWDRKDKQIKKYRASQHWAALVGSLTETQHFRGWVALVKVLDRPWWCRAWIVQEVILAEDVVMCCGDKTASWAAILYMTYFSIDEHKSIAKALEKASEAYLRVGLRGWGNRNDTYLLELVELRRHRMEKRQSRTLARSLEANRVRKSTDGRNKLYSILGLGTIHAEGAMLKDFVVDYKKPLQVFYDVVVFYLNQGCLDIICHCIPDCDSDSRDYSWIPDWSQTKVYDPVGMFEGSPYRASGGRTPDGTSADWQTKILQVRGFKIGRVQSNHIELDSQLEFRELKEVAKENNGIHTVGTQTVFEAIMMTLESPAAHWTEHKLAGIGPLSNSQVYEIHGTDVSAPLEERTLILTDQTPTRLGLASKFVKDGDYICVLLGATVPFILRELDDGAYYKLMGDCYIHDEIMIGSAMTGLDDGTYALETLVIK